MPIDLTKYSPPLWILKNGFVNERNQPLEFKNHYFLFDIYRDMAQRQVIKKCAQIGASVMMNLKAFHMAKYRGITTIYTMPSDNDVFEFVRTKTERIFRSNPKLLKEIMRGIDNVGLKQIGHNFIYFKGTRSKTAPLATTADLLIHDELDRSDLSIIEQYRSRIVASSYKGVWELSNPSTTNIGVDIAWKISDQKEWFIKCGKCGKEQPLVWDDNVSETEGIYVCKYCGKELTTKERRKGKWVATNPGGEISGYHISQMMAPWLTAKDLVREKERRGIEYFQNFILGEPSVIGTVTDFRQMILDCWTVNPLDAKPFFMGVDIGIEKHYVIGSKAGIFRVGKVKSREELEALIEMYNPTVVMDAGPERTWAEEFKKKYPKCYLCFYRKDKPKAEAVRWGAERGGKEDMKDWGYVWADRNRTIDLVINELLRGKFLIHLNRETLERFIDHWENLRRVKELTKLGTVRYIWESATTPKMDHWVHATVYYWLARQKAQVGEYIPDREFGKPVIATDGSRMRSLKEVWEEEHEF